MNLSAMAVTTVTGLQPVTAAFLHNGSTVVAALNGLRPLSAAARPSSWPKSPGAIATETED